MKIGSGIYVKIKRLFTLSSYKIQQEVLMITQMLEIWDMKI